jgi:hypothetical protein
MIEVKTADLAGHALDWAVGKSIAWIEPIFGIGQISYIAADNFLMMASPDPDEPDDVTLVEHFNHYSQWSPSRLWSQGGPLMDKYCKGFGMLQDGTDTRWRSFAFNPDSGMQRMLGGETILIAFCRALTALKLGETVRVPAELLQPLNPA